MIYIDTENNNNYLSERVGKCNRLDKCGYHYTPREYFADNPWLEDKRDICPSIQIHRENGWMDTNKPSLASYMYPAWVGGGTLKILISSGVFEVLDKTAYVLLLARWADKQHIGGVDDDIVL